MPLLFTLLRFRLKQGVRMVQSIGFGVLFVFLPLGFLGVLFLLQFISTTPAPWASILLFGGLISLHFQRNDRFFLEQLSPKPFGIYLLEYSFLSVFFWGCFIYWAQWYNVFIAVLAVIFLSFLPAPHSTQKTAIQWSLFIPVRWIPLFLWEWRAGFRKNSWWLLLYMVGFWGSIYNFIVPALTLLLALATSSFFHAIAPKEIIQANNTKGNFLSRKVGYSCIFFQGLLLPHYLIFLWSFGDIQTLLGVLFLGIISSAWISFNICLQYSHYYIDTTSSKNTLPLVLFVSGSFVPFLWPLLPFFWRHYWRKAVQQLNYYA